MQNPRSPQPPALWCKPRRASRLLGLSYDKVLRLAEEGVIPTKTYTVSGQKRFLIAMSWILSNSKGGEVA